MGLEKSNQDLLGQKICDNAYWLPLQQYCVIDAQNGYMTWKSLI